MKLSLAFLLILAIATVLHHSAARDYYPEEARPTKSGYLTVNSTTGSAIFYAFYEAQSSYSSSTSQIPILIWLQGGPGCSSMIGNMYELGPWLVNQDLSLEANPGSWNKIFGLLFLDSPIGVGFSIAASNEEIPSNQHDVAKHLFVAITKFVALDESFKSRPIFVTGESYAGKYVPALGYYILKKNPSLPEESRVKLGGVAIGNGLTHPEIQVTTHAVNAYNLGLIDDKQKSVLEKLELEAVGLVKSGNWSEATNARSGVLNTLENMTGLATLYDFRRLIPYQDDRVGMVLNRAEVKKALGVKDSIYFQVCSEVVGEVLKDDVMKSAKYMVEFLVKNSKVLLYQGQCDLRDGVVSTLGWVKKMRWNKIDDFMGSEKKIWKVDGKLAGYVKKWDSLSHVVVMNSGHLVPSDQPMNSQVMIQNWVLGRDLFADDKTEDLVCSSA